MQTDTHIHTNIHPYMHTYIHIYLQTYMLTYILTLWLIYLFIFIYIPIHTYKHAYIHTYIYNAHMIMLTLILSHSYLYYGLSKEAIRANAIEQDNSLGTHAHQSRLIPYISDQNAKIAPIPQRISKLLQFFAAFHNIKCASQINLT